jgi:hypothetical protein
MFTGNGTVLASPAFFLDNSLVYLGTYTMNLNAWYHVAVLRQSGVCKLYINGNLITSGTSTNSISSKTYYIGSHPTASTSGFIGYISNFRSVVSSAVYTSNFTPSNVPLTAISGTSLLTCQSNRFIDNSTNNFAITITGDVRVTKFSPFTMSSVYSAETYGGSGYFDGTGDYTTIPYNQSTAQWWDTDYTIEMWVYNLENKQSGALGIPTQIAYGDPVANVTYWAFGTNGTGRLYFYYFNGNPVTNAASPVGTVVSLNTWSHIAMVYNNSTGNLNGYINGTLAFSLAKSGTPQAPSGVTLNIGSTIGVSYNGYISNLRIVRGNALYNSNFTPPAAPVTAVANTSLLLNFTNAGIVDNSTNNTLETIGNAQISTAVKKYGTGSIYFDGTGDYLSMPDGPSQWWRLSNYTMEFWINTTSSRRYATITTRTVSTSIWEYSLMINYASATAGDIVYFDGSYSTGTPLLTTTGANVRDGAWHHVALVKNGNQFYIFVDGIQRATNTQTFTPVIQSTATIIGFDPVYTPRDFAGNISDFRITSGIARYTANFTPPGPLPRK